MPLAFLLPAHRLDRVREVVLVQPVRLSREAALGPEVIEAVLRKAVADPHIALTGRKANAKEREPPGRLEGRFDVRISIDGSPPGMLYPGPRSHVLQGLGQGLARSIASRGGIGEHQSHSPVATAGDVDRRERRSHDAAAT